MYVHAQVLYMYIRTVHKGLDYGICGKIAAVGNFYSCPNLKASNVVEETTVQCDTAAIPTVYHHVAGCQGRWSTVSEEMLLACTLLQQGQSPHYQHT